MSSCVNQTKKAPISTISGTSAPKMADEVLFLDIFGAKWYETDFVMMNIFQCNRRKPILQATVMISATTAIIFNDATQPRS